MLIRADGTAECDECGLPLFPFARAGSALELECANRHHAHAPVPADPIRRRAVDGWIARRGAQLHEQHQRWEREKEG